MLEQYPIVPPQGSSNFTSSVCLTALTTVAVGTARPVGVDDNRFPAAELKATVAVNGDAVSPVPVKATDVEFVVETFFRSDRFSVMFGVPASLSVSVNTIVAAS